MKKVLFVLVTVSFLFSLGGFAASNEGAPIYGPDFDKCDCVKHKGKQTYTACFEGNWGKHGNTRGCKGSTVVSTTPKGVK